MVKQRIIRIVAILLICLILSSCVGPPVGHTYVDNVDRYLEFNSYVTDMLQKNSMDLCQRQSLIRMKSLIIILIIHAQFLETQVFS